MNVLLNESHKHMNLLKALFQIEFVEYLLSKDAINSSKFKKSDINNLTNIIKSSKNMHTTI